MIKHTKILQAIQNLKEQILLNELSNDGYYLTQKCKDDYKKLNELEKMLQNKL